MVFKEEVKVKDNNEEEEQEKGQKPKSVRGQSAYIRSSYMLLSLSMRFCSLVSCLAISREIKF